MTSSMARKNVKANAKQLLKGNWGKFILILIITGLIAGLCTLPMIITMMISGGAIFATGSNLAGGLFAAVIIGILVSLATVLLVMAPLGFGITKFAFDLSRGETRKVSDIFCYFGNGKLFGRSIKVELGMFWRTIVCSLPMVIPAMLMWASLGAALIGGIAGGDSGYGLAAFGGISAILFALLYIAGAIISIILMLRYVMAQYISVRNPDWNNKEVFKKSVSIMKGRKGEYFVFMLSFIGWGILAILPESILTSIGIGATYQGPTMLTFIGSMITAVATMFLSIYMLMSEILFYNYLYSEKEEGGASAPSFAPAYEAPAYEAPAAPAPEAAAAVEEAKAEVAETAEEVKAQADEIPAAAEDKAEEVQEAAEEKAEEIKEEIDDKAEEAADKIDEVADDAAEETKE